MVLRARPKSPTAGRRQARFNHETLQERLMTHAHFISTAERRPGGLAARAGSRIAKAWHSYWKQRAKRVTVELLSSLDDRTLRDIGVGRDEISSVVYGKHGDRTRCYEESWRLWHAGR
jgi:uncharacterized protein YjiS (DUF1127 family)